MRSFRRHTALIFSGVLCFSWFFSQGSAQAQLLTGISSAAEDYAASEPAVQVMPLPEPSANDGFVLAGEVPAAMADLSAGEQGGAFLTIPEDVSVDRSALLAPAPASVPIPAPSKPSSGTAKTDPVDLSADNLTHDDQGQVISASGHVMLSQSGRTITADEVRYELQNDRVIARGNVVLHDVSGDVHFADELELSNEMRDGFVNGLQTYLAGGGLFVASKGERKDGTVLVMHDASYTACDCETDKDGNPTWRIRAKEVTYDTQTHEISYRNARFDIFGVPVAWTPFFSHSDGKIKRKSGVLSPQFGYDSQLGLVVTPRYYWDIAPDKDATLGLKLTSKELPVLLGEYRQRFAQADLKLDGSVTRSGHRGIENGREVHKRDETRSHLFVESLWDINEKWRSGLNLELVSDKQYLRQYDISDKDLLEDELYLERFSGRDYFVTRALAFQDTRVRPDLADEADQPNIFPEAKLSLYGEPNRLLGGRWTLDASALGLSRGGSGQDVSRGVLKAGWERRLITDFGLVNTVQGLARADAYNVNDRDFATAGSGRNTFSSATRLFARGNIVSSYPLVRPVERADIIVEPVAALTVAPKVRSDDPDIPNEDSQDVQIDAGNLFEPNRFPGEDRIEDGLHATYGLRSGVYGHEGSFADAFIGQSYRFSAVDNPFPNGSGLSRQYSDIVGQFAAAYVSRYGINYRFQVENTNFTPKRHELDAYARWSRLRLGARYLFAKALEGTDISETREQLNASAGYRLHENWFLRGAGLYDLGSEPGLRTASLGFEYLGCCMSFGLTAKRTLTTGTTGDSGTDVIFRIGLKDIGEFAGSDSLSSTSE